MMNKEIFLLLMVNIISGIGYSLVAPLYPSIAMKRGLSEFIIGFIISIYAVSNLIVTPFTQNFFKIFGKKKIFLIAITAEALCAFVYGMLDQIENVYLFIFTSIFFRFIHGLASSISSVLISFVEEDQVVKTLGILEFGWRLASGPLIGSLLYYIGGYTLPFIFFGILILICIPSINSLEIIENIKDSDENFFSYMFDYSIILVFLCVMVDCITKTFYFPSLTNHLQNRFGLSLEVASLFFVIDMVMYVVTLNFLNGVIKKIGLKMTILIGLILNSMTVLFLPPISYMPQSPYTIFIGLFISGISNAAINVPSICELIKIIKEKNEYIEDDKCNDVASCVWNLAVYSGEAIGPTFGGYLTNSTNFDTTCIWVSLINLVYGFFYFINNKTDIFKDLNKRTEKIDLDYLDSKTEKLNCYNSVESYISLKAHLPAKKYMIFENK